MNLLLIISTFLTFLTIISSTVNAWGNSGHKTVGQIAQNFLRPDIEIKVKKLLQDFGGQLANAATWADQVKTRYPWSRELHYMNTHDNPGRSCSVNQEKDCFGSTSGLPDHCVVGALVNYTSQLDCRNGLDIEQRDFALRFLTHYFGDLTQPLHISGRQEGGNQALVRWGRRKVKLHAIWDSQMVDKRIEDFDSDYTEYSNFLTTEIQNGTYASEANDWVACLVRAKTLTKQCTFNWAADSNKFNCPFVWSTVDEDPELDLSQDYYKAAVPIIDKQLAKGGYRLGTFLNLILRNC